MSGFKKVVATVLMAGIMAPTLAFAQTSTSTSALQALLDQIKALQAQIVALQQQQVTAILSLQTTLGQGSHGDNVKLLQQLLAQDPSIYPEGLITGQYGRLTMLAVKRFQKKHGLEEVGNVGPRTLQLLNQFFKKNSTSTPPRGGDNGNGHGDKDNNEDCKDNGRMSAPGWLKNWGPNGSKDRPFPGNKDCNGNGTTTPPVVDTTAPVISGVAANGITSTGATIAWATNEGATSQVEYGTTNLYGTFTSLNTSLVTSHSTALAGLTASTTYHFRVWSKDAANNTASSSDMMFATSAAPDTTAPVISGINVTNIATTTATVSWNTDEAATGKVSYGTTSPVDVSTAASMSNLTLSTSHMFVITGLNASTTYFFVAQSADAANNGAATTTQSFVTTP